MNTLFLDLISGISGDMFIAALLDLGVDERQFEAELRKLHLDGYHLHVNRAQKSGISGVKFDVHTGGHTHAREGHSHDTHEHDHEHEHPHEHHEHSHDREHGRNFSEIKALISRSHLSEWVKQKAIAVFERIAIAEGKVHGVPPEQVHFHEVGAVDSIVDIVGACIGLELLGKPKLLASRVEEGQGWIQCAHGRFPIPAPATLAILGARGIPISQCEEQHELVTPTGAAILAEFVESFDAMRHLTATRIGYGLGTRENKTRPNVLRVILSDSSAAAEEHDWEIDRVAVLEADIDDLSPEILGQFMESALAKGALDVFYIPIHMKKNRPAVLLTVLCPESDADAFCELILRETSSFGVRRQVADRRKLRRETRVVRTPYGEVHIKLGLLDGKIIQAAPEFEDCRRVASHQKVPLKAVYEAALKAPLPD